MALCTLPEAMWKQILQYVPLKDRLGSCSLVSTGFLSAATAATDFVKVDLRNEQRKTGGLLAWLENRGQHVTRLEVLSARDITQLPCRQLQHLDLLQGGVLLGPRPSKDPGVLQACTGLTRLQLSACNLRDSAADESLAGLSQLVQLQSLVLQRPLKHVFVEEDGGDERIFTTRHVPVTFPGRVLPSLVHLTNLALTNVQAVSDLQHIGCLSKLCELRLAMREAMQLTPSIAPGGFHLPVSLHTLILQGFGRRIVLDPRVLQPLTGLRVLDVTGAVLTTAAGPGDGVASGAAMLAALLPLQQLQCLGLEDIQADWPVVSPAYSALAPSTSMTNLTIVGCSLPPDGVPRHMFVPGRVLPQLRLLHMWTSTRTFDPVCCWDQAAVANAASCCPGLRALQCALQPGVNLAQLSQLTGVTQLSVYFAGGATDAAASAQSMAAMSKLRSLELNCAAEGGGGGLTSKDVLLPLITLRKLTSLVCEQRDTQGGFSFSTSLRLKNKVRQRFCSGQCLTCCRLEARTVCLPTHAPQYQMPMLLQHTAVCVRQ